MRVRQTVAARVEEAGPCPIDDDGLLAEGCFPNVAAAAKFSGCSATQLRAAMHAGRLPYVRDGRALRIPHVGLRWYLKLRLVRRADLVLMPDQSQHGKAPRAG